MTRGMIIPMFTVSCFLIWRLTFVNFQYCYSLSRIIVHLTYLLSVHFFLFFSLLAFISNFHSRSMDDARLAVRTMAILHAVCERYPAVHYSEFYNDALNDYCMNSKEVSHQHLN